MAVAVVVAAWCAVVWCGIVPEWGRTRQSACGVARAKRLEKERQAGSNGGAQQRFNGGRSGKERSKKLDDRSPKGELCASGKGGTEVDRSGQPRSLLGIPQKFDSLECLKTD
ncbi:hypothetical protein B0T22DRAFT_441274 [Podospora appendiculata]|uniref:Secreted protein n=1 Tax=Podospora appendiculata TaxID=314037 RepID=A0AAE0XC17_9PEZI|nr:hypothetical protein B0T22DRAFT_441274 [Podospora appendiculata]